MDISLLNAGLAAGAALAALPVILHLFMKQTPKHVIFPALRLIRERQKRSRKKLRVKNWLLLLARMALLALMALALARPRVVSETSGRDGEVPSAIALVFDTTLSMGYKEPALKDKSRLEEAKEYADDLLKKTPDSSEVFVIDSANAGAPSALSPASARKQIQALTIHPENHRPLNTAVGIAYSLVAASDRDRREVFVMTDLARSSWDMQKTAENLDKVEKAKAAKRPITTFVIRLSPKELHDVAVVEAEPSTTVATQGESVAVTAKLRASGQDVQRVAEFFLDGVLKDKKQVDIRAGGDAEVKFTTPKLDPAIPFHQGTIRVTGPPDPLAFDDERFFSFKVEPAVKVLVLSTLAEDADFIAAALDPDLSALPPGTPRNCRVDRAIVKGRLTEQTKDSLKDYTCVFLNNVSGIDDSDWARLNEYVRNGGGLVVGLGNQCDGQNYNSPSASPLVPGSLVKRQKPVPKTTFGTVHDFTHPLFVRWAKEIQPILSQVDVYQYWSVAPSEGSRTLLSYADNSPALIERTFQGTKTGHVLLWTTPLARRFDSKSLEAWNEFPARRFWPFVGILMQTLPYMSGTAAEKLNYEAGDDAVLAIDPTRRAKSYFLEGGPEGKTRTQISPPATSLSLLIPAPQVGQWKITATGIDGTKSATGFSVNPPVGEMSLVPLETSDLEKIFAGKEGTAFQLASDLNNLRNALIRIRVGRELFPWIMMFILLLVTLENFLANRFYRERSQQAANPATARA